ncbi:MAG: ArsA family ATPase [Nitrospirota bacterium]
MESDSPISDEGRDERVLPIGGKGGVGKTTCSAAIAARFAATGRRTLIITSDATPSLSDIFRREIGDRITAVDADIDAYEISQDAIMAWWKSRFGRDFSDILDNLIDVESLDKVSQHQLLDYIGSAPSLREETMLDMIRNLVTNRGYDRIVWDTAPAGETLNLLDMPRNIRSHLRAGAKVFEGLDRLGKHLIGKRSIAAIMDEWGRVSDELSRFIHDHSGFIIVTNPEALVVNQTERIFAALADYRIPVRGLVINRVIERSDSPSLDTARATQTPYIEKLKTLAAGRPKITLPLSFTEIRGIKSLQEIGEKLTAGLSL